MPTIVHVTDLHLDHWPGNLESMATLVCDFPADLFLIGGDNGNDDGLRQTVAALRASHPQAAVAWIRGNHDLWHGSYQRLWDDVPGVDATYLEAQNFEANAFTVVGTYGHYDYSGGTAEFTSEQYETFTDGRCVWNDRFIDRRGRTNPQIAAEIAERFRWRYESACRRGLPIVAVTHTWPFAPTDESGRSFISAYCCNQLIGNALTAKNILPEVLFCGHTHRPARWDEFGFPIINTGSDYKEVRITRWELSAGAEALPTDAASWPPAPEMFGRMKAFWNLRRQS